MIDSRASYCAPQHNRTLAVTLEKARVVVESAGHRLLDAAVENSPEGVEIQVSSSADRLAVHTAAEHIFSWHSEIVRINAGSYAFDRRTFFQDPYLWHRNGQYRLTPEIWTETNDRAHPERPKVEAGVVYRRTIPGSDRKIAFEVLDLERHLDVFHSWHNLYRVSKFWELDKPKDELRAYIETVHADPHHIPFIASIDGEPSGYFEVYWTPEDRLGPYYKYDAFDRGFHFLIGNNKHLGHDLFRTFLESITHFLFLDDARTRSIMAEPRSDNIKLLRYVEIIPYWDKLYEFDFPHKRAALLTSRRELFFTKGPFA